MLSAGPCATFNPEPLAEVADVFVIGEGEEVINDLLDVVYKGREQGLGKEELLLNLAQVEGLYVPRFYTACNITLRAILPVWSMTAVCRNC